MEKNLANEIYLRRKNLVMVDAGTNSLPKEFAATALKNFEALGYIFSAELFNTLLTLSEEDFVDFYKKTARILKKSKGAHVVHKPMYPNFPKQVMEASYAELYINAILHYLGDLVGTRIMPDYEKEERFPLIENTELTVIGLGDVDDFREIFTKPVGSNTSLSQTDKDDLEAIYINSPDGSLTLPASIPQKENLSLLAGLILTHDSEDEDLLLSYFKTATDVLRLATSLSGGDISLAAKTKYKNFNRKERKLLLGLLENLNKLSAVEDMNRHRSKWIRLGEKLHPGEYARKYPKAAEAFSAIRDSKRISTFNSKVENYLERGNIRKAADLLTKRPGDFARRLDHLLRKSNQPRSIVQRFQSVAEKVATPVLLQVMNHFETRNDQELRLAFPKGNIAKVRVIENELPKLNYLICKSVADACTDAILDRYLELPDLGKVYVDDALKNFPIPFSQRSASKSLRTVSRGSKFDLPEGKVVRFFIHWKDKGTGYGERVDLDLSAMMYDENWNYKEHISYTNLRSGKGYNACHSGDITSAPRGASEFIDIDIDSFIKYGGRYVIMNVLSYSGQPFSEVPECFAGWMIRKKPQSGEIFEPKTVQDKVDLTADSRIVIPIIIDLVERKVIWSDLAVQNNRRWCNNVEGNEDTITLLGRGLTQLSKPNLYTLFSLHAAARGEFVQDPEEADVVFSVTEGTTPYDIEEIVSEYLV